MTPRIMMIRIAIHPHGILPREKAFADRGAALLFAGAGATVGAGP